MVKVEMIVGTGQPTDFQLRSLEGDDARSYIRAGWNVGDTIKTTQAERDRYFEHTGGQFLGTEVAIEKRSPIIDPGNEVALIGVKYLTGRIEP